MDFSISLILTELIHFIIFFFQDFRKWLSDELHVSFLDLSVLASAANIIVLTFAGEEQLQTAIQSISNKKWRGNELTCVVSLNCLFVLVLLLNPCIFRHKFSSFVSIESNFSRL